MEILIFLICPIAFVLSRVYLIDSSQQIVSNISFIAVSFMISILVYNFLNKYYKQNGIKKATIIVAIGVILDQLLKYLVYKFDIHFNIIGTAFRIRPTQKYGKAKECVYDARKAKAYKDLGYK